MIGKLTRTIVRTFAFALALCATTSAWAAAPTPVAEWNGDLENNSTNGKYTMSSDSSLVSFTDGKATLTSSSSVVSKGVQISWPDPASDAESFTSKKMSVVLQYSGLSILSGNTSLLSALWGGTSKEYMVRTTSDNGTAAIATDITGASSAGNQHAPSSNFPAPTQGKLLVCFSGDSSHLPGIDLYFSTYDSTTATYGDYQRVSYWSEQKVDNGTFYGLKIGGTIANTGKYYRPGMTVEAVQIYDTVVSASSATISANTSWSSLVWDHERPDFFPAANYTYQVNVTEDATLNLDGATIAAQSINFNIASGKTLTLEGTATITGASISVTGGGKLKLNTSNPGCAITVASGGTMDIAAATVSCAITNYGTMNVNGCSVTGVINNYGTIATSGTTSIQNASSQFYESGTLSVSGETTLRTANDTSNDAGGLRGRVIINENARLISNYSATPYYSASLTLDLYGELALGSGVRWVVGGKTTVNVYSGGKITGGDTTNGGLDWRAGGGVINAYATSTFTAGIRARNSQTITVNVEGSDVVFDAPIYSGSGNNNQTGTINKTGAGTFRTKGGSIKNKFSGTEGTIEITTTSSANTTSIFTGSTFSGVLKVTNTNGKQNNFDPSGAKCFADGVRPEFVMESTATYFSKSVYNGTPFYVRDLSGTSSAVLDARMTTGPISYTIDTLQTKDTEYLGIFNNNDGDNRTFALNVTGNNVGGVHTLTLGGDNKSTAALTVSNYAKVKFNSSGKWAKGPVVVENNGFIEAQHTAALGAVTLQEGSTVVLASGVPFTATGITLPDSGTVYVDMSAFGLAEGSSATIISATTLTGGANVGNLQATSGNYTFALDPENANVIKATNMGTCVWDGDSWSKADPSQYSDVAVNVASEGTTLTLDADYSFDSITLSGSSGSLTIVANGHTLTVGDIIVPNGVTLVASSALTVNGSISGGGNLTVPDGVTFTCAEGETWCFGSSNNDTSVNTGIITVESGGRLVINGCVENRNKYSSSNFYGLLIDEGGTVLVSATGTLKNLDATSYSWYNIHCRTMISGSLEILGAWHNYGIVTVASTGKLSVADPSKVQNVNSDIWNYGRIEMKKWGVLTFADCYIRNYNSGVVAYAPNDAIVGQSLPRDITNYISFAQGSSPTVLFDVANLTTLPSGTSTLTLLTTVTTLTLGADSLTGCSADYYVKQNATTGAVTLQLYMAKDDAGGYYRDSTGALLAMSENHALTLTILDGTEEDWTADAISPYGLERSGTSVYYVAAKIGSTPYNSLQGAVDAAESGETIVLAVNSDDSITLNGKNIVFSEGSYTFSGSFTGSGTLALTALLKSAHQDRWAAGWTGTVVLPTGALTSPLNFNLYGISGSSVQITGDISGYLPNEEIVTTVKIPDSATLTLTSFSPSFANTFAKIEGEGTLSVPVEATNVNDLGNVANWGAGYNYSAYLLIKDVSGFTGSLTANKAVGIAIGTTKPHKNTVGGKIIVSAGKSATIASGKTWSAANGIEVNGTLNVAGAMTGGLTGGTGVVNLKGASIDLGKLTAATTQRYVAFSGESTLTLECEYSSGSGVIFNGDTIANPFIKVESGATLNLSYGNFSGWNGDVCDGYIVNEGTLNISQKGSVSTFFRNHLILTDGCTTTIGGTGNLSLYGGVATESTAQIQLVSGEAEISSASAGIGFGNVSNSGGYGGKGVGIAVGDNATLTISAQIYASNVSPGSNPVAKYGNGTLVLSHASNSAAEPWTLNAGVIKSVVALTVNSGDASKRVSDASAGGYHVYSLVPSPATITTTSFDFNSFTYGDNPVTLGPDDTVIVPSDCTGDQWNPTLSNVAGHPVIVRKEMNWKAGIGIMTIDPDVTIYAYGAYGTSINDGSVISGSGTLALQGGVPVNGVASVLCTISGEGSFSLANRNATLTVSSPLADGKVTTSVTGAKVISESVDAGTRYRVVYGTIFSVY